MSNFRYSLRQIAKYPGFSLTVIVMLALGIGASTAMYSIYHTVLLRPLPVAEPQRLVNLSSPGTRFGMTSSGRAGRNQYIFSYPMYRDLEAGQRVFSGIAGHRAFDANVSVDGQTTAGTGMLVSGNYFGVLGLQPALGNLVGPQHERAIGESSVVVLSFDYWQSAFGGSHDVLDRTLQVNGQPLTVIGVAPESFTGTTLTLRPDVFVPLSMYQSVMPTFGMGSEDRRAYWIYLFARLRDGIGREEAAASLNALYSGIVDEIEAPLHTELSAEKLEEFLAQGIVLEPGAQGQSTVALFATRPLTLLLGVTGLVLAIVCVNIAGLLLVRGESRVGESAVRVSIGADSRRLVMLFMTEAAVLAMFGGLASLPVAFATVQAFVALIPVREVGVVAFGLDRSAYLFAAAVSMATVVLFGLAPAVRASRVMPAALVNAHGKKVTGGRQAARIRSGLVVSQIAVSTALLVLSGLLIQSLYKVTRADLGMDVDRLVSFSVSPRLNGYGDVRADSEFDRIEQVLRAEPGVTDVTTSMVPLLTGSNWRTNVAIEGMESGHTMDAGSRFNRVSPGFFRTMAMPLLAGRDFTAADDASSPDVAIVNQAFLRKFGLGADAVGKRLGMGGMNPDPDVEIIGVVADAKYSEVKDPAPPQIFLPRAQGSAYESLTYYLRGDVSADTLMRRARELVARVDPNLPVDDLMPVPEVVRDNVFLDRIVAMLASGLASLAIVLASVGLFGAFAYSVGRQTRELGIRLALGAMPQELRAGVLSRVGRLTVAGILAGLVLAGLIGFEVRALLFETTALSPAVWGLAVALVALAAFAAGLIPARRASKIAPIDALRYE